MKIIQDNQMIEFVFYLNLKCRRYSMGLLFEPISAQLEDGEIVYIPE